MKRQIESYSLARGNGVENVRYSMYLMHEAVGM